LSYINLVQKSSNIIQKSVEYKINDFFSYMQKQGHYNITASLAMQLYDKNSALADAVDTITKECKGIEPVIKVNDKFIYDHEILTLLKKPNKLMDYGDFIEAVIKYKLLSGNCFLIGIGNIKFTPTEVYIQPTEAVSFLGTGESIRVKTNNSNALIFLDNSYIYDKKTGRYIGDNFTELLHIKEFINYTTTDGYVASSKLSSIFYELEIMNEGNNHNMAMLMNGVNLNGVFNIDASIESIDQFKQDVRTYFRGSSNAGKYLVSQGKTVEFRPIQMSNKDMEYEKTLSTVRKVIYDRFQIPAPLWSEDSQKYSNYATAQYDLYTRTVLPEIKDVFRKLTTFFKLRGVLKPNEEITYDPTMIEVLQEKVLTDIKTKKDIGVYTNNEIREMLGESDLGEQNSVLYQPMNLVPVGSYSMFDDIYDDEDEETEDDKKESLKRFKRILKKKGMTENEINIKIKEIYKDDIY
jgi:HK97 family phage portal protein